MVQALFERQGSQRGMFRYAEAAGPRLVWQRK